ncbi:MAG: UDP-N-acetylmuramate--L-alanine ligase [Bacteroidales bacterium]|nr:UDP-N-acetylmuramate--L-alanine ligase [Bacteroidales bacterium]
MNYYFLGIGGIGMSALARFFHRRGDVVSGYDRTPSPLTDELSAEGIPIHFDDNPDLIPAQVDLVVYTPAVPTDSLEFQALVARGLKMEKRSQVLGEVTRGKRCIAVAGSHGKTTTTTMIAHLLSNAPCGCSAFLGGISKNFNSNLLVDNKSQYVVVEADEYDRSFLQLHPYMAVITATDPDHLDIYGTHEHMMEAYLQFANQVDADGHLFLKENIFLTADGEPFVEYGAHHHHEHDDEHHHDEHHHDHSSSATLEGNISTYTARGIEADYYAINVRNYGGNLFFDLRTPNGVLFDLELQGAPLVNVENAVAASAVALSCGLDQYQLRSGLKSFAGVRRRFDYRIREKELVYIDDYAHHPNELRSTIEAVRYLYPGKRVVGIFQPHLYTRTRDFADEFASVLQTLDEVIMMSIYPAREKPILGVTSSMVLRKMDTMSKYLCTPDQVLELVPALCPDVVLTLGAGDIDRLVPRLETVLRENLL